MKPLLKINDNDELYKLDVGAFLNYYYLRIPNFECKGTPLGFVLLTLGLDLCTSFINGSSFFPLFTEQMLFEQVFYSVAAVFRTGNIGTIGFHVYLILNGTFA